MTRKQFIKKFLVLAALLLASTSALAAGKGGHGSIADLGIYFFNFSVFLIIIFFLTKKSAKRAWANRHTNIYNLVNAAEIKMAAAREKLARAEQELASLNERIIALEEDSKNSLLHEKEQMEKDCEEQIIALKKQNETLIAAESNASRQEIEKEISLKVLERAESILKSEFSAEQDLQYRQKLSENIKSMRAN